MSAAYRSVARLPTSIFEELLLNDESKQNLDGIAVRSAVSLKLKQPFQKGDPITTVGSFLKQPPMTLVRIFDPLLTYEECLVLRSRICHYCAPPPVSASSILASNAKSCSVLSTGIKSLDDSLKGGIRVGSVSELVGPAGVGKSQLAMQLSVTAALRGFGTVYIDTEKKLSLARIREIAIARSSTTNNEPLERSFYGDDAQGPEDDEAGLVAANKVLNNITVHSPSSSKEMLQVIQSIEEEILLRNDEALSNPNKYPVNLLVVDSIAAPSRRENDTAPQRVALLVQIAQLLKRLADQLNLSVVTINQVGAANKNALTSVKAALGETWHHCLSTRVVMEGTSNMQRTASVVKSNVARNTLVQYEITTKGLVATDAHGVMMVQ